MDKIRKGFEEYIMNITVPDNLELNQEKRIVSDLYVYCKNITPSILYRYRCCTDYHIDAFEKDQLFLSKPSLFNDPHDSLLYINRNRLLKTITSISSGKTFDQIDRLLTNKKFREEEEGKFGIEFINKIIENATFKGRPIRLPKQIIEKSNLLNKHQQFSS